MPATFGALLLLRGGVNEPVLINLFRLNRTDDADFVVLSA